MLKSSTGITLTGSLQYPGNIVHWQLNRVSPPYLGIFLLVFDDVLVLTNSLNFRNGLDIFCTLQSGQTQTITVKATGASVSPSQMLELMADEALYAHNRRWTILEVLIVFFMAIVLPILAVSEEGQNIGPLEVFRAVHRICFPFPYASTVILVGAWVIHLAEAYSAHYVAKKLGLKAKQASSWFWWTFLLGYPSFRWLLMLRYETRISLSVLPDCCHLTDPGRDCNKKAKIEGKDLSQ